VSWPGAMCAGAGGWFTGDSGWMAGASITSGCNGSGVRMVCKGPYHARGNAPVLPGVAAGLIQSLSQGLLPELSAWVEVGGIASSLCLRAFLLQPISI
jgi:hypothetical protein